MTDPPSRSSDTDDPGSETRCHQLNALFEDVTGTTEVVTEQEATASSRDVDGETTTLSEDVRTTVTDDGLTDAIDDPEMGPK